MDFRKEFERYFNEHRIIGKGSKSDPDKKQQTVASADPNEEVSARQIIYVHWMILTIIGYLIYHFNGFDSYDLEFIYDYPKEHVQIFFICFGALNAMLLLREHSSRKGRNQRSSRGGDPLRWDSGRVIPFLIPIFLFIFLLAVGTFPAAIVVLLVLAIDLVVLSSHETKRLEEKKAMKNNQNK